MSATTVNDHPAPRPTTRRPAAPAHARRAVIATEFRLFRREPLGVAWGVVLPTAAFVVLGLVPGLTDPSPDLGGGTYLAVYQAVLPLLAATLLALTALPPVIAAYRERGVLRRYAVTPMSPALVLGAQLLIHLVAALCTGLLVLVVGAVAFDTWPGAQTWGWLLTYLVAVPSLLALGLLVSALAPNAKVAGAIGSVLFFPMLFSAGLWIPRATMPGAMRAVCDWTPLGAANRAMSATLAGHAPPAFALLALAAYGAGLWWLAVRSFRWS